MIAGNAIAPELWVVRPPYSAAMSAADRRSTMRAVRMAAFGPPDVLRIEAVPAPVAGPGEAVIEVAFANITFVETMFRATGFGPFAGDLPVIPGNGVGGRVVEVGAGVDADIIGKRVVTSTGGSGGYAERVAVPAAALIPVPAGLDLDVAVALLADGRTATMLMDVAQVRRDDRVLVEAAAGGVGSLLVQLAHDAGATVVAAAGGARKAEIGRALGADVTVDYNASDWPATVRAAIGACTVVFDGVGGEVARAAFSLLGDGGRMISYGAASGDWAGIDAGDAAARGITLGGLPRPTPEESRAYTERAFAAALAGRLRPLIGQRFPLARAADAHAAIEARVTIGKTLLEVG
jgi:NADPH2:quinone reductase